MRLATWNVNSVRTRVDRIIAFLERENVDALAMQETKCRPEQFPLEAFVAAGYEVAVHGLNQWNGVAIASRVGLADVATSFPGQPAWAAREGAEAVVEARALGATGPQKRQGVDAGMAVEPAVLDADGNQRQPFPHLGERDGNLPLRVRGEPKVKKTSPGVVEGEGRLDAGHLLYHIYLYIERPLQHK